MESSSLSNFGNGSAFCFTGALAFIASWRAAKPGKLRLKVAAAEAPEVAGEQSLRESLCKYSGLPWIERYTLDATDLDACQAAEIVRDSGFVVVRNALSGEQVTELRSGCRREAQKILRRDPARVGNRGGGRYSFGEAQRSGHLLHCKEWGMLVDLDTVTPVLKEIFSSSGYICAGAGGDFVLGGVEKYQHLHADIVGLECYHRVDAPSIQVNFTVEPLTWENGPTRIIPGTHLPTVGLFSQPPSHDEERDDWKLFTLFPVPAGSAIIRDNRTWHGGTPNLSSTHRFLPNCEYAARWWQPNDDSGKQNQRRFAPPCMPQAIYQGLSDFGREISELLVAREQELELGVKSDFGCGYASPNFLREMRDASQETLSHYRQLSRHVNDSDMYKLIKMASATY